MHACASQLPNRTLSFDPFAYRGLISPRCSTMDTSCCRRCVSRAGVSLRCLSLIKEAQLQLEKARQTVNKTLPMLTSALREQKEGVKGDRREGKFSAEER